MMNRRVSRRFLYSRREGVIAVSYDYPSPYYRNTTFRVIRIIRREYSDNYPYWRAKGRLIPIKKEIIIKKYYVPKKCRMVIIPMRLQR